MAWFFGGAARAAVNAVVGEEAGKYIAPIVDPIGSAVEAVGGKEASNFLKPVINPVGAAVEALVDQPTERHEDSVENVKFTFAPAYGQLRGGAIYQLDNKLKAMIAETVKAIERLSDKSWENIVSCMKQNPVLELQSSISNSDKMVKNGTNVFKFDGSPDSSIVREVETWFIKLLCNDSDARDSSGIDIERLGKIVAQTGATINSFQTFFSKREIHRRTVLNVGILRFPQVNKPHFKLYRIKLVAWSDCSRVLFVQDDASGIEGEFDRMKFGPCESTFREMRPSLINAAAREAEEIFSDRSSSRVVRDEDLFDF